MSRCGAFRRAPYGHGGELPVCIRPDFSPSPSQGEGRRRATRQRRRPDGGGVRSDDKMHSPPGAVELRKGLVCGEGPARQGRG